MSEPNERVEAVVAELAALIGDEHTWDCLHDGRPTLCTEDVARAVLAYLHGAGVIYWGAGRNPMPAPPPGAGDPYAVRLSAEVWHPTGEETEAERDAGIRNFHWLAGVLGVAAGYPSDAGAPPVPPRIFLDELTPEQVAQIVPVVREVLTGLEARQSDDERLRHGVRGLSTMIERADNMRARLAYDAQRGITVDVQGEWARLGWDIGLLSAHENGFGHPSRAIESVFYAPAWKPTELELAWFRAGFSAQRKGSSRPVDRG